MASSTKSTSRARYRELAHRANALTEVWLFWRKGDDSVLLRLLEVTTGVEFELRVHPEDALDAFNHPYTHLPKPNVDSFDLLAA